MTDYISREAALEAIKTAELGQEYEAVESIPAADVVKVVHGKWKVDKKGYPQIICSLCDVHIPMVAGWCMDAHINYCPNCGAKMDGGDTVE